MRLRPAGSASVSSASLCGQAPSIAHPIRNTRKVETLNEGSDGQRSDERGSRRVLAAALLGSAGIANAADSRGPTIATAIPNASQPHTSRVSFTLAATTSIRHIALGVRCGL